MSGSITTSGLATPLQPQTVGLLVDADEEHTLRRANAANPAVLAVRIPLPARPDHP